LKDESERSRMERQGGGYRGGCFYPQAKNGYPQGYAQGLDMELTILSLLFALIALGAAWYVSTEVSELIDVRRRLRALEADLPAIVIDTEKVMQTLRRLEGRQTQKLQKRSDPDAEPDSKTDPDGWKLWKNRQLLHQRKGLQ